MYKLSVFDNKFLFIIVQQSQNSCIFVLILGYYNLSV